ncbi:hypothetical protein LZ31DRAFT_554234, partial [Colletotrichum somersetense]
MNDIVTGTGAGTGTCAGTGTGNGNGNGNGTSIGRVAEIGVVDEKEEGGGPSAAHAVQRHPAMDRQNRLAR